MAIAFLGYVLPWGQMSYWGATVITNLFRVVPVIGNELVKWVWGGFSVRSVTLTRFFGLHVILPLVLCAIVGLHIILLHSTGSSNPLGIQVNYKTFHPYWTYKDVYGLVFVFIVWGYLVFLNPFFFMDRENFIEAKFLVTPIHIQPEWYFLPAYAVLRSVPKKLGGVIGLLMVYAIFYLKPFFVTKKFFKVFLNKVLFWNWIGIILCLLWIGRCPVEGLYIIIGQVFTFLYFFIAIFI
jgi:ubiquinol-cytochrome c reductase cytochrome b subunit